MIGWIYLSLTAGFVSGFATAIAVGISWFILKSLKDT